MDIALELIENFHLQARTSNGIEFAIDAHSPTPHGPAPMQLLLASVPACAAMDIVSILRKQRVEITAFRATVHAERAPEHPRVFTAMHLHFELSSPNAEEHQLLRAIELTEQKYCSAWAMVRASGCSIRWTYTLERPHASPTTV